MKMLQSVLALLTGLLYVTAQVEAKAYRIVVVGAQILPTKANGDCWDPCLPNTKERMIQLAMRLMGRLSMASSSNLVALVGTEIARFSAKETLNAYSLPDPFVVLKLSNGQTIKTHHVRNTIEPQWGTTERVFLKGEESIQIYVWDKDLKHHDPIGYTTAEIPFCQLRSRRNATWTLRPFGRVLSLRLQVLPEEEKKTGDFKAGFYRLTLQSASIARTKSNAQVWDRIGGKPDPYVVLSVGKQPRRVSDLRKDTFSPIWNKSWEMYLTGKESFSFAVFDKDLFKSELIGRCQYKSLQHLPLIQKTLLRASCGQVKDLVFRFERLR